MKECNCHRGPEVGKKVIGCPPKVININHPQEPVLFHRVDVPAAMGDDTTYPPENGLYKNVLLVYEANGHIYLYNSDGIPTSLTVNTSEIEETLEDLGIRLAQETEDRLETDIALRKDIDEVAEDLEEFKNSPDVVDIVPTYAALQAYDTSKLGDNDIIRVLQDEQHDGQSSYYRWSKTASTWTFIGTVGDYYTKAQTDTLLAGKQDVLVAGQNIQIEDSTISATDTTYSPFVGTDGTAAGTAGLVPAPAATDVGKVLDASGSWVTGGPTVVQTTGTSTTDVMSQKAVTDALAGVGEGITKFYFNESESAPSAHISIYKDKAMTQLATSADVWNAKDTGFELVGLEVASSDPLEVYEYNVYPAIFLQDESMNESATNVNWCTYSYGSISMWNMQNNLSYATYTNTTIPTVVQTMGTSTTDVMSQKATTTMVHPANDTNHTRIAIGQYSAAPGTNSISIGYRAQSGTGSKNIILGSEAKATSSTGYAVSIGSETSCEANNAIAIGTHAKASYQNSIAIGNWAETTHSGEVNIGSSTQNAGYNNSNYRLLAGVYDPQSAHDAATKGYVDTSISAIGAGTRKATSTGWNTSAPLDYILQQANSPSQAQGAMFYTGKDLSDFPRYVGIGIYSADTNNEPWPYLLTQTTSDDGLGTTTGNPAAYRMALHSEIPTTFTTNEWNALWA